MHKIIAETIDPERSGCFAQKLGMTLEGTFLSHMKDSAGKWADVYWYGICNSQEE